MLQEKTTSSVGLHNVLSGALCAAAIAVLNASQAAAKRSPRTLDTERLADLCQP